MSPTDALASTYADLDRDGAVACVFVVVHQDGTVSQYISAPTAKMTLLGALAVAERDLLERIPPLSDKPDS